APGSESVLGVKIAFLQNEGRLKEAADELNKAPAHPNESNLAFQKALQLVYERKFDDAAKQIQENTPAFIASDPRTITFTGYCQLLGGRKDEARATFQHVVELIKPSKATVDARMLPSFLAWAYAGLGEKEEAIEEAKKAVSMYKGDVLAETFTEQV